MLNNNQHCLVSIRNNYGHFSDKERLIADFILKYPDKVIHYTINQISEKLSIADSTVFRFCKRIGFKGFQSMKIALAAEVVAPIDNINEKIEEKDSVGVISEKIFRSNIKTIEDTLQIQDENLIIKAVNAIMKADRVHFFGSGGSAIVALDAYHKFIRSGINANADLDSHLQIMSASQMKDKDLAVLISLSGSTKDLLDISQVLKNNKVPILAITNFAKSYLAERADIALYTVADETDFRLEVLSSRIAQLSIIDALYTNVMILRKELGRCALQKMRESVSLKHL
ncbi:MurR/RpiR family transcriptional regulator [Oceanobacillus profundus]|uniref:MurR/RpiR family transcriptional regulator n=1 Tax=Oceanobacillus profundus TaxID=372463 RepID=A0A417YBD4_9BACI|nr:MurR/RpiR family transcriptional regulator [Oceanobacillus profundus]PAE27329.1 RpiR family transcriptional regulator [Paenibacillus sp. 7884-2]RHW29905.1 MurR/RpiR family transcriptional regulator [Oceanobacillus profundus]